MKLRGPSERCVERVHEELQRIVELCGTEIEVIIGPNTDNFLERTN